MGCGIKTGAWVQMCSSFNHLTIMKFTIVVRFSNSDSRQPPIQDLLVPLLINPETENVNRLVTVSWLRNTIRDQVPTIANRRLRLIVDGRVLNEATDFRRDVFLPRIRRETTPSIENDDPLLIFVHCVVGDILTREQLAQENELDRPQERSTAPEVIGFDRLLQQGFSADDIADLRRQFLMIYDGDDTHQSGPISDLEEEEQRSRRARMLEERWIESTVPQVGLGLAEAPPASTDNTADAREDDVPAPDLDDRGGHEDVVLGLLLGMFLGALSVVLLVVDDSVLNSRQKMAVAGGLFFNFSLSVARGQWM